MNAVLTRETEATSAEFHKAARFVQPESPSVSIGPPATEDNTVEPTWWETIQTEALAALKLPDNWDGMGAGPATHQAVQTLLQVLNRMSTVGRPMGAPSLFYPTSDGGFSLEWDCGTHGDYVVDIQHNGAVEADYAG